MENITPEQLEIITGQLSELIKNLNANGADVWSGISSVILTSLIGIIVGGGIFWKNMIQKINGSVDKLKELEQKFNVLESKVDKINNH